MSEEVLLTAYSEILEADAIFTIQDASVSYTHLTLPTKA